MSKATPIEEFSVDDDVRFSRFGEWLDGRVIQIEGGLLCITYGDHGSATWRNPSCHGVVRVEKEPS